MAARKISIFSSANPIIALHWRALEDMIPEIMRIAMHGPMESDKEFVERVFVLLSYELKQRRKSRDGDEGKVQ